MAVRSLAVPASNLNLDAALNDHFRIRLVIVDDSPELLEIFCNVLRSQHALEIVGRARDGSEAVEMTATLNPDLVLMDVQMPRMDGLSAAVVIALHFPNTCVVLMSGDDSPQLRAESRACGAQAFIYKPNFNNEIAGTLELVRRLGRHASSFLE